MRLPNPLRLLRRLVYSLSVHSRIIVLALIPVIGFLANAATYMSGESDVGQAFVAFKHSSQIVDTSRQFNNSISRMRSTVKDFAAAPSKELIDAFQALHQHAINSLDIITQLDVHDNAIGLGQSENAKVLRQRLTELKTTFDQLVNE